MILPVEENKGSKKMYTFDNAPQIAEVMKKYWKDYGKKPLPRDVKEALVSAILGIYQKLSFSQRKDILVPASADYLEDSCLLYKIDAYNRQEFDFKYKWPQNSFKSEIVARGSIVDRIGSSDGNYLCPLQDHPYSIETRSLPYYFFPQEYLDITSCPSYHCFLAKKDVWKIGAAETKPAFSQKGGSIEYIDMEGRTVADLQSMKVLEECRIETRKLY